MKVYVLWNIHELNDDYGQHDEEKLIGIYSTEEKASKAIEAHKGLEGFRDYPVECFEIHEAVVDRSNWNEGFTTVRYQYHNQYFGHRGAPQWHQQKHIWISYWISFPGLMRLPIAQ